MIEPDATLQRAASADAATTAPLLRGDFDFDLPPELIAQRPLAERSASRLLRLDGDTGAWQDRQMSDLPALLTPGDLLVFNDTRVLPARLAARKPTGGRVELLLERALASDQALVQIRDSKSVRAGMRLASAGGELEILGRDGPFWRIRVAGPVEALFEAHGALPLPPYIERAPDPQDRERYQSVFARRPGAVAAPTASLHFDQPLLAALDARGIERTLVTLHVGAGTFQPLRSESLETHVMHKERYAVGTDAVQAIVAARGRGARVIAVGTTVARTLETVAQAAPPGAPLIAGEGESQLFIRPGFRFRVIDGLLTNFHLPQSTLLMLVAAFGGRASVLAAYAHAVRQRYRFFSYGDAMLVWPQPGVRA